MSARPEVDLAVLDVGQGDTIVVSVPETGEAVVIDCVDPDPVFAYLRERGVRHLRGLVLTHLHLDHYRGAIALLQNCEQVLNLRCEALYYHWDRPARPEDEARLLRDRDHHDHDGVPPARAAAIRKARHAKLLDWGRGNREHVRRLAREKDYEFFPGTFGNVLELVHPWYADLHALSASGLNDTSAVIRVRGSGATALLMGDVEAAAWRSISSSGEELRADVLKFPHHGAWAEGDLGALLDQVCPKVVIVSVGTRGAAYNHPHHAVLAAVRERAPAMRLLCTQATEKCGPVDSDLSRLAADAHARQAATSSIPVPVARSGCSCAGTVVISLGAVAEMLHPAPAFHQQIISSLLPNHQCALFSDWPSL